MEVQFPHEYLNNLIGDRIPDGSPIKKHADMRKAIAVKLGIHARTLERYLTGQADMASRTVLGLIDALDMTPQEINKFMQIYRQSKHKTPPSPRRKALKKALPRNK